MGCNCGRGERPRGPAAVPGRRAGTVYRLTLPTGVVRDYPTLQEADAANKRAGSGGSIVVVPGAGQQPGAERRRGV
ncbi:DUF7196 family protein [Actinacidiphila sp. bgisy167]|uniref:DUF7196 family protein n=1 Tax=Actinacidiphila sp. bgisy167 TaxID=3413797 RepID=UPI003D749C81